ncbi:hypothetical protein [Paenibacillus sp. N3.4]|nr:hypothetical protein [Paenibacillus sp. N3.4]
MNTLLSFLSRHALSIVLIAGVLIAVWLIYKNKDKLIRGTDDK